MHCTVSTYTVKTDHICHAQYSNYIAATHNITHSPCTSKCTTHPPPPTPLPSTTLLCTQLTNTNHICMHCKNSRVEITHMSVTIVCCLLECVLKQHLYLISCVISTQRGQYNTPMHMTGCRFSTPVCCCST